MARRTSAQQNQRSYEEWRLVQKKAFTGWANGHLSSYGLKINDLYTDLADGLLLITLCQAISGKSLGKYVTKPATKFQKVENVNKVLHFLKSEGIELVNMDASVIMEGKSTLILGLFWTVILRYQVKKEADGKSPKQVLLAWIRQVTDTPSATDFSCFMDGVVLSKLVNYLCRLAAKSEAVTLPDANSDPIDANELAMNAAFSQFEIPLIVDADVMASGNPDDLSVLTYLSYYRSKEQELLSKTAIRPPVIIEPDSSPSVSTSKPSSGVYSPKSAAFGKGLRIAYINMRNVFTIEAFNKNGVRCRFGGDDVISEACYLDGEEVPVHIVDDNNGVYRAEYVPPRTGKLMMLIRINDEPVLGGGLYEVDVTIHPDTLAARGSVTSVSTASTNSFLLTDAISTSSSLRSSRSTFASLNEMSKSSSSNSIFKMEEEGKDEEKANKDGGNQVTPQSSMIQPNKGDDIVLERLRHSVQTLLERDAQQLSQSLTVTKRPSLASIVDRDASSVGGDGVGQILRKDTAVIKLTCPMREGVPSRDRIVVKVTDAFDGHMSAEDVDVADLGEGQYEIRYLPRIDSIGFVAIWLDGAPLPGSPFVVKARLAADPTRVKVNMPNKDGDANAARPLATLNEEVVFVLQLVDVDGNPRVVGGDDVEAQVEFQNNKIEVVVHDHDNGSYDVKYRPSIPGVYSVAIQVDKVPVEGSPFQSVVATETSSQLSFERGIADAIAYQPSSFVVYPMDVLGEAIWRETDELTVDIMDEHGEKVATPHITKQNQTFMVTYTIASSTVSHVTIAVILNGAPIKNSPFVVRLDHVVDVDHSTITKINEQSWTPESPPSFLVQVRDAGQAPLRVKLEDISIVLEYKDDSSVHAKASIEQSNDDIIITTETALAGDYRLDVIVMGKSLAPVLFSISEMTCPAQCYVTGITSAHPLLPSQFLVHLMDTSGKPRKVKGDEVTIDTTPNGIIKQIEIVNNGDGTCLVRYMANNADDHHPQQSVAINVFVNGQLISAMPALLAIKRESDASQCRLMEPLPSSLGIAGVPIRFSVMIVDKAGQGIFDENDQLQITVNNIPSMCSIVRSHEQTGQYDIEWIPSAAMKAATVQLLLNDQLVPNAQFQLTFSQEPSWNENIFRLLSSAIVGEPMTILINLNDVTGAVIDDVTPLSLTMTDMNDIIVASSNEIFPSTDATHISKFLAPSTAGTFRLSATWHSTPCPVGIDVIVREKVRTEGFTFDVRDNNDGTYTVQLMMTITCVVVVDVAIEGETVRGSPFLAKVDRNERGEITLVLDKLALQLVTKDRPKMPFSIDLRGNKRVTTRVVRTGSDKLSVIFTPVSDSAFQLHLKHKGTSLGASPYLFGMLPSAEGHNSKRAVSSPVLLPKSEPRDKVLSKPVNPVSVTSPKSKASDNVPSSPTVSSSSSSSSLVPPRSSSVLIYKPDAKDPIDTSFAKAFSKSEFRSIAVKRTSPGKYQFGSSPTKEVAVKIAGTNVMVRSGSGWILLDAFLAQLSRDT